jgi:hypothetical protein
MTKAVSLLKKLGIRSGTSIWMINVPQELAEGITAGAEVEPVKMGEPFDAAMAFCKTQAEVEAFGAQILERLPEGGLMWIGTEGEWADWGALQSAGMLNGEVSAVEGWTLVRFERG